MVALLKNAGETVSDNLLIVMILKGLPNEFQPFVTVKSQREQPHDITFFKTALRTHEETMKSCASTHSEDSQVMYVKGRNPIKCYQCGKSGHKKSECRVPADGSKEYKHKHKRWFEYHRSCTHDTEHCRMKKKEAAKMMTDLGQDDLVAFKVTVDQQQDLRRTTYANPLLVDTGALAHIINDKSKFCEFDERFDPDKHYIELADGSQVNSLAKGRGMAKVQLTDSKGVVHDAVLNNALYVPSFTQNIFSGQYATKNGSVVEFRSSGGRSKVYR